MQGLCSYLAQIWAICNFVPRGPPRRWELCGPPYVCRQCCTTMYFWCTYCEVCGFYLHTVECPMRGKAHPTPTNGRLRGNVEDHPLHHPHSRRRRRTPAPPPPRHPVTPDLPVVDGRHTWSTKPYETTQLVEGDWLLYKNIVAFWNQECCHHVMAATLLQPSIDPLCDWTTSWSFRPLHKPLHHPQRRSRRTPPLPRRPVTSASKKKPTTCGPPKDI